MVPSPTNYIRLHSSLPAHVKLVAVSKVRTPAEIMKLYDQGHRDFGENYVQELLDKKASLPADINWHFIGHLQSNKVKLIADFVHLVHGVDSFKLLTEINKQAKKAGRTIDLLLQVHVAMEETKYGLNEAELDQLINQVLANATNLNHISINGIMGMASFTDDVNQLRKEFRLLKSFYNKYENLSSDLIRFEHLSMGMSSDYQIAIEEGSNMVRIGSLLFGRRD